MKIEVLPDEPINPPRKVVMTMSFQEARDIHNALYIRSGGSVCADLAPLRELMNGLTAAKVQLD